MMRIQKAYSIMFPYFEVFKSAIESLQNNVEINLL